MTRKIKLRNDVIRGDISQHHKYLTPAVLSFINLRKEESLKKAFLSIYAFLKLSHFLKFYNMHMESIGFIEAVY